MSESNMTAAFWDFLKNMVGERAYTTSERQAAIDSLKIYLQKYRDT
jgi:hypothetical protein